MHIITHAHSDAYNITLKYCIILCSCAHYDGVAIMYDVYGGTGFGAEPPRAPEPDRKRGLPANRQGEPRTAPIGPRHVRRPDWSRPASTCDIPTTPRVTCAPYMRRGPNTCPRRGDIIMPGARPPQPPTSTGGGTASQRTRTTSSRDGITRILFGDTHRRTRPPLHRHDAQ
uniref:Uncharacterized protein n=1 Tax=Schizaphis graminum TaxID=13262 RepID=A0A2S2PBQ8_SCHGA